MVSFRGHFKEETMSGSVTDHLQHQTFGCVSTSGPGGAPCCLCSVLQKLGSHSGVCRTCRMVLLQEPNLSFSFRKACAPSGWIHETDKWWSDVQCKLISLRPVTYLFIGRKKDESVIDSWFSVFLWACYWDPGRLKTLSCVETEYLRERWCFASRWTIWCFWKSFKKTTLD